MSNTNKDKKVTHFRLSLLDAKTHQQLYSVRFNRTGFFVSVITIPIVFCALVFCIIAFTPIRTFIPGYPDARTKRAAIQNAYKVDSLENAIYRWELYSESIRRVLDGDAPINIDSIISVTAQKGTAQDASHLRQQDSLLRKTVKEEESFEISGRTHRDLPIEGILFFSPLKGVVTNGYDPAVHPFVDIAAAEGSVVNAIADGTVIYDGWSDDNGYTIQIQHEGDIVSTYKHNQKLIKRSGDKVKAGSPIAIIGNTGELSTGTHLHFELWYKGESIDPTKYINF